MKKFIFITLFAFCLSSNAALAQGLGADNTWTNNNRFKGPDPFVDITDFGARAFSGGIPQGYWATCNSTATITLSTLNTGFTFVNGDGITVYGCGATNTMLTPSVPTVTPATAAGETGTGWYTTSPVGTTQYSYAIVARDRFGGLTKAGPTKTIMNGQATLGLRTDTISSITRTNDTITVTTAAANLVGWGTPSTSGTIVHVLIAAGNEMNGFYAVGSVINNTTFKLLNTPIDTRAQGWASGDSYAQSSGTVSYYVSNHIAITPVTGAWEYYICGQRPGDASLKLIGLTKPQGVSNGYQDINFDDYGSPFMDGQSSEFPSYVTNVNNSGNSACTYGAATNDMLTTTVVAGGGTLSLTVANAASQTTPMGQLWFSTVDAAPAILAAAQFADYSSNGGNTTSYVYIPGSCGGAFCGIYFHTFSPLIIPSKTNIVQEGPILAHETITVQGSTTWSGRVAEGFGAPQFGWGNGAPFTEMTVEPGLYLVSQGNLFDHLNITNNLANGGTLVVTDNAAATIFDNVNFESGGGGASTDYLSMNVVWRDTSGTIDPIIFRTVAFGGGPDQVTDKSWTPLVWFCPGQNGSGGGQNNAPWITIDHANMNRRGLYVSNNNNSNGPGYTNIDWVYRQGGLTPLLALQNPPTNVVINMHNISMDTEANPVVAYLSPSSGGFGGLLDLSMTTGGTNEPIISGVRPVSARISLFGSTGAAYFNRLPNRNGTHEGVANGVFSPFDTSGSYLPFPDTDLWTFMEPAHIQGGQSFYFDLATPTSVSGTAATGGSVPSGTYYYAVSAVGADNGETIVSLPSSSVTTSGTCPGSGNCTVNLTWSNPIGTSSNNVYRCSAGSSCLSAGVVYPYSNWSRVALHRVGTSYSDSAASGTSMQPPFVTGTGSTILNSLSVSAPLFQAMPSTFSNLASCATNLIGRMATVSDSTTNTWGNTITGGGADVVLAFCDGTNWTVYGK